MKKKVVILLAIFIFVSGLAGVVIYNTILAKPERLTPEQIEALRKEYPIFEPQDSPLMSRSNVKIMLETHYKISEGIVYVEILDDGTDSSFELRPPETEIGKELAEKAARYGGNNTVKTFINKAKIINSSAGDHKKGQEVTLVQRTEFGSVRKFKKGSRIITLYGKTPAPDGMVEYDTVFFYYVTPDGYVISSYEEQEPYVYNGLKAGALFEQMETDRIEAVENAAESE